MGIEKKQKVRLKDWDTKRNETGLIRKIAEENT